MREGRQESSRLLPVHLDAPVRGGDRRRARAPCLTSLLARELGSFPSAQCSRIVIFFNICIQYQPSAASLAPVLSTTAWRSFCSGCSLTSIAPYGPVRCIESRQSRSKQAREQEVPLRCLTSHVVEKIRTNPSEVRNLFASSLAELRSHLGSWQLDDAALAAVFCSAIASRMAPYGPSDALIEGDIMKERFLNCANYTALMGYLLRFLIARDSVHLRFIGFYGGAFGTHVQVVFASDTTELLLDPTVDIAANAGLGFVLSGRKITFRNLHFPSRCYTPGIQEFRSKILKALSGGLYKPADILYLANGVQEYVALQSRATALIRARNVDGLRKLFPSTAGDKLVEQLTVQ